MGLCTICETVQPVEIEHTEIAIQKQKTTAD
jgi:hypothetical protein